MLLYILYQYQMMGGSRYFTYLPNFKDLMFSQYIQNIFQRRLLFQFISKLLAFVSLFINFLTLIFFFAFTIQSYPEINCSINVSTSLTSFTFLSSLIYIYLHYYDYTKHIHYIISKQRYHSDYDQPTATEYKKLFPNRKYYTFTAVIVLAPALHGVFETSNTINFSRKLGQLLTTGEDHNFHSKRLAYDC